MVSLMVGSTVDRFDCEGKYGLGGDDMPTIPPDFNLTTLPDVSWTLGDNITTIGNVIADAEEDVKLCKVAVAAAVTFLGGTVQVKKK